MNMRQKVVVWVGLAVVVLMGLYTLWKWVLYDENRITGGIVHEYAFVLLPPKLPTAAVASRKVC